MWGLSHVAITYAALPPEPLFAYLGDGSGVITSVSHGSFLPRASMLGLAVAGGALGGVAVEAVYDAEVTRGFLAPLVALAAPHLLDTSLADSHAETRESGEGVLIGVVDGVFPEDPPQELLFGETQQRFGLAPDGPGEPADELIAEADTLQDDLEKGGFV